MNSYLERGIIATSFLNDIRIMKNYSIYFLEHFDHFQIVLASKINQKMLHRFLKRVLINEIFRHLR